MQHRPTTAGDLLELIAEFVTARSGATEPDTLHDVVQRFDVALGEYIADQASLRNEG